MKGIPDSLLEVRRATKVSADALEELIEVGSRAVSNLDVSVAAFRTTLDREFTAAARLHHHSSQVLAESARQIGDGTGMLTSGADDLTKTARAHTAAVQKLDESIRQHILPGNAQFRDVVQVLSSRVAASDKDATALSSKLQSLAGDFDKLTSTLTPSIAAFCEAIGNRFTPAVTRQSDQAESIARSMQQLREMAESVSHGTTTLNSMLQEVAQLVGQTKSTHEALIEATNNLAEVGRQVRQSMTSDVAPSQRAVHEVAASLAQSTAQLSDFVAQGINPATRQLATLHQTLAGLAGTVETIKQFSGARADIDRLNHTLAQAAKIGDAISALPEQIQRILEQNVDHHVPGANSSGRLMTWLSRRPR
jgi:hypothetical protein